MSTSAAPIAATESTQTLFSSWRDTVSRLWPFPRMSARLHIVVGLTSLVGSSTLLALFLGLIPDKQLQEQQSRITLAESITILGSALLKNGDLTDLRYSLEFIIEQNPSIHAMRLERRSGGEYQFLSAAASATDASSAPILTSDVTVPIVQRNRPWGELVVEFVSTANAPRYRQWLDTRWAIIGFISIVCFPLFYFFLGKVLKELNPSSAVPSRVRSALDTIAEALLVLDIRGNIVLANSAFIELTGQSMEQLMGQPAKQLPWENSESYVWEDALNGSESTRHEKVRFTDLEGVQRSFIVNCSPVITAQDEVGGVLVSMDDITQLEKQEVQLRESMELAEEANSAKSSFLSNMSHEIRTPMTAILGFTEVMRRNNRQTEGERQEYLNTIAKSGQHLLELINDVLDLSKVESGAMEVEELPCQCAEIANDVIRVMQAKADEKSIGLSLDIATALPDAIHADPSRLRQVITNLVGNAIKFTDSGDVIVRLSASDSDTQQEAHVVIEVTDSGIGMSEDQQLKIFDAFAQADTSIARRFGGTGLGLSISRQLTEAMQGQLSVSSEPDVGSTFRISLPFNNDKYELLAPEALIKLLAEGEQKINMVWDINPSRVLVVDDGPENRQLLSIVLGDMGLSVDLANNGQEGVDALFNATGDLAYDAVLMDIQMPVMDGYTAASTMRERGATLPVVALTANAMKGFEEKVLASGFSHYMPKPIDIDKLGALLAKLLGGVERQELPRVVPDTPAEQTPSKEHVSTQSIVSELARSDSRFIPIVEDFRLRLSQRTVELRAMIESEDWQSIHDFGHWLKGSASSVGLNPLAAPGIDLETAADAQNSASCISALAAIDHLQHLIVADPAESLAQAGVTISTSAEDEGSEMADVSLINQDEPVFSDLPVELPEFYEVVSLFVEKLQQQMQTLHEVVASNDMQSVADIAHWLRGSGGNVGYLEYLTLCDRLELSAQQALPTLNGDLAALEHFNQRVLSGWQKTLKPEARMSANSKFSK